MLKVSIIVQGGLSHSSQRKCNGEILHLRWVACLSRVCVSLESIETALLAWDSNPPATQVELKPTIPDLGGNLNPLSFH